MDDETADARGPWLPTERRERLLRLLTDGGTHRVDTLADRLHVTAVTVRRDLTRLAEQGLVERVRGGVRRPRTEVDGGGPGSVAGARLGLVVPTMRHLYWPEVVRGTRAEAARRGATIVLRGSSYDVAEYRRDVATLLDGGDLAGLIAAPTEGDDPELGDWLTTLGVPVVLAERQLAGGRYGQPLESVSTDHALGAGLAVRHLAAMGHRRIGLLLTHSVTAAQLRAGWEQACTQLGLPVADVPVVTVPQRSGQEWIEAADRLIATARASGTTALLLHPDDDAIAFVDRCADQGVQIPEDLSVITYNDEIAGLATPALTAISPPKAVLGEYAVTLLAGRLAPGGAELPVRRVVLSPRLVERDSTAAPPASR